MSTPSLLDTTAHDQISQAFPLPIYILQVIKYWRWERGWYYFMLCTRYHYVSPYPIIFSTHRVLHQDSTEWVDRQSLLFLYPEQLLNKLLHGITHTASNNHQLSLPIAKSTVTNGWCSMHCLKCQLSDKYITNLENKIVCGPVL